MVNVYENIWENAIFINYVIHSSAFLNKEYDMREYLQISFVQRNMTHTLEFLLNGSSHFLH